jgi:N-alpha-acetyltransferase 10/11
MVETFGAHYVSLHVRVSNEAAIHLYRHTLGFQTDKTEAKYYADGEDAFSMRLELAFIREQLRAAAAAAEADKPGAAAALEENEVKSVGVDDHGEVGEEGAKTLPAEAAAAAEKKKKKEKGPAAAATGDKKRKVKVGRALGVGELVERDESKHS